MSNKDKVVEVKKEEEVTEFDIVQKYSKNNNEAVESFFRESSFEAIGYTRFENRTYVAYKVKVEAGKVVQIEYLAEPELRQITEDIAKIEFMNTFSAKEI